MKLTDIQSKERWLELEKDIHERFGLASNVFNAEGFRITDYNVWVNRICPVIKSSESGQSFICAVSNMNIADMAKKSGKTVIEECDAGLLKLVVPVFVKGEFLGTVGGCGLLLEDGEVDVFMIDRTLAIGEEKIGDLSSGIRVLSEGEAEKAGEYIFERIRNIVADFENRNG